MGLSKINRRLKNKEKNKKESKRYGFDSSIICLSEATNKFMLRLLMIYLGKHLVSASSENKDSKGNKIRSSYSGWIINCKKANEAGIHPLYLIEMAICIMDVLKH